MIRYEDIASSIQVRHLQVRIEDALTVGPDDDASHAAAVLASRGYDQAPVIDAGRVIGVFWRDRDRASGQEVGDAVDRLAVEYLVSADAPVAQALAWLMEYPCLFVLDGRRISGFLTPSDLNKQPARLYFYLLIASLEMALAQSLRRWTGPGEERILESLPASARARVLEARSESRSDDVDADLIAFLSFSDILRAVGRHQEIRSPLGIRSARAWHDQTGGLTGVRNAVMHPARDLLSRTRPLSKLVDYDAVLRRLLHQFEDAEAQVAAGPSGSSAGSGPAPVTERGRVPDAQSILEGLVGREIPTMTGKPNRVLRVAADRVVVATTKTPLGAPVPIKEVQSAIDRLWRDGEIEISVASVGYRSAFIGAVLQTIPGTVALTRPRRIRLTKS